MQFLQEVMSSHIRPTVPQSTRLFISYLSYSLFSQREKILLYIFYWCVTRVPIKGFSTNWSSSSIEAEFMNDRTTSLIWSIAAKSTDLDIDVEYFRRWVWGSRNVSVWKVLKWISPISPIKVSVLKCVREVDGGKGRHILLASQDALEVMWVAQRVSGG